MSHFLHPFLVLEKDLKSATTHTSDQFLAVTNHDVVMEAWLSQHWRHLVQVGTSQAVNAARELVEESMEPKECICDLWRSQGSDNVSIEDVKSWLRRYPMKNECTHFSCIMDPLAQGGGFRGTMGIVIRALYGLRLILIDLRCYHPCRLPLRVGHRRRRTLTLRLRPRRVRRPV